MNEVIRRRLTRLESRITSTNPVLHVILQIVSTRLDQDGIRWNRISRATDLQTQKSTQFTEQEHPWVRADGETTPG